jgi:hypothetical protein
MRVVCGRWRAPLLTNGKKWLCFWVYYKSILQVIKSTRIVKCGYWLST